MENRPATCSEWMYYLLARDLVTLREAIQLLKLELAYRQVETGDTPTG